MDDLGRDHGNIAVAAAADAERRDIGVDRAVAGDHGIRVQRLAEDDRIVRAGWMKLLPVSVIGEVVTTSEPTLNTLAAAEDETARRIEIDAAALRRADHGVDRAVHADGAGQVGRVDAVQDREIAGRR